MHLCVLGHYNRVEGQTYGVFGCMQAHTTENACACQNHVYGLECMCVNMHRGAFIAPFACCDDSPVTHKPGSVKLRKSGAPLCHFIRWHGAAAGQWRNLIIKWKLVILPWGVRGVREGGWLIQQSLSQYETRVGLTRRYCKRMVSLDRLGCSELEGKRAGTHPFPGPVTGMNYTFCVYAAERYV